ncbi:MAG: hypothetical protein HY689_02270 [Chloroflexi bacterium]|nr:hypothetical protein [Chloroflexota bacterium]
MLPTPETDETSAPRADGRASGFPSQNGRTTWSGTAAAPQPGKRAWFRYLAAIGGRATALARVVAHASPLALDLLALAFLAAAVGGFFWDSVLLGRLYVQSDTINFYYPFFFRYDRALERGVAPFWAPEILGGYPLYADGETGVFSPVHFLAIQFLTPVAALVWSNLAKLVLAAWWSYGYGRAIGLTRLGSAVVGLVFNLGSFLVVQLHHANITNTAIWLPLILCFIELAMRSVGLRRHALLLGAGVALGVAALGLHVQILLMILPVVAAYLVFRGLWGPFGPPDAGAPRPEGAPVSGLALAVGHVRLSLPPAVVRQVRAGLWLGRGLLEGMLGLAQRLIVIVYGMMVVLGVGLSLGMVQLLPVWELSRYALRGHNLGYGFASSYSMTPHQLINLLFPYFFRTADRKWWSLWPEWESTLYIGMAPLLLALLAVLLVRSRYTVFFLILGALGAALSLGAYAPLDLHRRLWELPGFDLMRAPGRFMLLAAFAGAVLAGLGADWLDRYLLGREPFHWRSRIMRRLVEWLRPAQFSLFLILAVLLVVAVVWGLAAARSWVQEHQQIVLEWVQRDYLSQPKDRIGLSAQLVYDGLLQSLDVRQLRTLVGIGLLAGSVGLLAALAAAPGLALLWRAALLLLIAGDLLFFARGFHPMIWREELERPKTFVAFLAKTSGLSRSFGDPWPWDARPNRLLPWRIATVNGYTSLTPTRQQEYISLLQPAQHTLLSLAGVRYLIRPATFTPLPSVSGASYHPSRPLLQGTSTNPNASGRFRVVSMRTDAIKLIAGLEGALELAQGTPVAEITVYGEDGQREMVTVRAGEHVTDQAAEAPELAGRLRHQKPRTVAFKQPQEDPWSQRYEAAVSYAEIPLPRPVRKPTRLEFRTVVPQGRVKVYGLTLHSRKPPDEHQIMPEDEERYHLVYEDAQVRIFEHGAALPRAFVVSTSRRVPANRSTLRLMAEGPFDPQRTVWLEGRASVAESDGVEAPQASAEDVGAAPVPARIVSYDTLRVVVEADATRPGYLVLTDSFYPGWKAYVDGVAAPLYRADYLYRAVPLERGRHRVEFVFEPRSVVAGARLSVSMAGLVLFFFSMFGLIRLVPLVGALRVRGWGTLRRRHHRQRLPHA